MKRQEDHAQSSLIGVTARHPALQRLGCCRDSVATRYCTCPTAGGTSLSKHLRSLQDGHHHDQGRHGDLLQGLGDWNYIPVVFSHGWPLIKRRHLGRADVLLSLASRGFRCVSYDRRGHGRSGLPCGKATTTTPLPMTR